ncbi:MAG: helicase [Moraxellaceae bacterium]|nr:MAG: helicase [Moraxellaceae bacterium]
MSHHSYRKPTIHDSVLPQFVYTGPREDATFFHGNTQTQQSQFHQGVVYQLTRNKVTEKQLMDTLFDISPSIMPLITDDSSDLLTSGNGDLTFESKGEWKQFFLTALPQLKQQGWQAVFDDDFRYHFVSVEQWYGGVEQTTNDWLGLELGIQIDGEQINLLPLLVKAIEQSPEFFSIRRLNLFDASDTLPLTLDDGRIIELEVSRLKALLGVLVELFDQPKWDTGGKLKLPAAQQARIGELQLAMGTSNTTDLTWHGDLEILENATRFSELQHAGPIELPTTFNATLRDYQTIGVSWLQSLREQGVSGILADDMGLGKTIQTLAHLSIEKSQGRLLHPVLIIAPTSLLHNWRAEAKKFTPDLRVMVLHGTNRFKNLGHLKDIDIVITTYALALRDIEFWTNKTLSAIVLDEAQNIKNSRAKVAKAIKQIEAPIKLCLTGTPLENHLGELWSLFDFLMPGFLETESLFKRLYRNPIEKDNDQDRGEALFNRIAPFMMRRNKNEVLTELPPKTEIVVHIPLAEEQQDLYETIRLSSNQKLQQAIADNGLARNHIMILDALLKLRQICCDPRLTKFEDAQQVESAKLKHLIGMVSELNAEGRRILIFSQFTSMLKLIAQTLTTLQFSYVTLTGATRDREKVINQFQQGEADIFLISLKAGGVGLNLTAADTVIHYDPWWNPAAEQQATDRAYRIGQDKPVFVYKLLIENSVEEQIFQLQQKKLALMNSVFDAAEQQSDNFSLGSEELMALLE